jgi:hypothetical protein
MVASTFCGLSCIPTFTPIACVCVSESETEKQLADVLDHISDNNKQMALAGWETRFA